MSGSGLKWIGVGGSRQEWVGVGGSKWKKIGVGGRGWECVGVDGSGRGHDLLRHIKNVNGVNADGADSMFF